ncbi:hypothetical protein B0H10DRAFT_2202353 [Mycena sp. CBHHK59/15]|nr:hypothetical protein B0H10DRAFT_2202353 [Mycena sp. CBHHK59/15]
MQVEGARGECAQRRVQRGRRGSGARVLHLLAREGVEGAGCFGERECLIVFASEAERWRKSRGMNGRHCSSGHIGRVSSHRARWTKHAHQAPPSPGAAVCVGDNAACTKRACTGGIRTPPRFKPCTYLELAGVHERHLQSNYVANSKPVGHGKNGEDSKEYPADTVLLAAFTKYGRENSGNGLSYADQISRLHLEFGFHIGRNKLAKLRKQVGADSVRKSKKSRSETETAQLVLDLKEGDVAGGWGVTQVKGRLANQGVLIPSLTQRRDELRAHLHDHLDHEFDARVVGRKRAEQHQTPLDAFGPWHQEHSDGHEKLAEQGLRMGSGIHLPIYASKDQWAAYLHSLILMPNVRDANAIVHYYLDLVEDRGYRISMQLTTDQGSEVNEVHKVHQRLPFEAAPEYTLPAFPFSVKQGSTKNTPIESFWRWLRDGEGHSVKKLTFMQYCSAVFYWLWIPIIQLGLDTYREYWNNHTLSKSKNKKNPSGSCPTNMFLNPGAVSPLARDCSIRVNPETVAELREAYGGQEARDKAYRFVSDEFKFNADLIHEKLGEPELSLRNGWTVFQQMVPRVEELRVVGIDIGL